ncbi:ImmA/IrrE family metallo-endopeptidase [Ligilactobacillus agilis]|nr:ImmA/IrrE family metallo-endopeptidase [Ligilactobacillus agilis]
MKHIRRIDCQLSQLTYLHIEMPQKLAGFIHNNTIFINKDNSYRKQLETIAEEIGHYETSAGDIVDTENKLEQAKQERKARDWGYQKIS